MQELDLQNHRVLFEWHSLDHVGLDESHWPLPKDPTKEAWDYIHLNSVAIDTDGDLLVNSRHTWTAYKIDRQTGAVRWRLGGKRSDFEFEDGAEFAYEHDVRRRADGAITLFDNAASQAPQPGKQSRALALDLDLDSHTASVADEWVHPDELLSETQGDTEVLPNGNVFVGWGSQPAFSEFTAGGELVFDGRIGEGNDNYRAYRGPWTGRPATTPARRGARRQGRDELERRHRRRALAAAGRPAPLRTAPRGRGAPAWVRDRAADPRGRSLRGGARARPWRADARRIRARRGLAGLEFPP